MNLAPSVAEQLRRSGYNAVHVYDRSLGGHADPEVMATAAAEGRCLISADTDFGELLAIGKGIAPSVILLRRTDKRPAAVADVLIANLDALEPDLVAGALAVIGNTRIRVRRLPMRR